MWLCALSKLLPGPAAAAQRTCVQRLAPQLPPAVLLCRALQALQGGDAAVLLPLTLTLLCVWLLVAAPPHVCVHKGGAQQHPAAHLVLQHALQLPAALLAGLRVAGDAWWQQVTQPHLQDPGVGKVCRQKSNWVDWVGEQVSEVLQTALSALQRLLLCRHFNVHSSNACP